MTVGETLTEARYQAGLTVDELSERTRIRATVIRSIEQDDYEACGGDLYVRGYVRAIAGAVGIDAQPLIREYELGRAGDGSERANGSTGRHAEGYPAARRRPDRGDRRSTCPRSPTRPASTCRGAGRPACRPGPTRFDLPRSPADARGHARSTCPVPGRRPRRDLPPRCRPQRRSRQARRTRASTCRR